MKYIALAFQFLTRIPLPFQTEFNGRNLRRAFFFFPVAGLFIGACTAVPPILSFNNRNIEALLSLLIYLLLTGGLHLDGLSDTADGFFSAHSKDKILQIMSDPHTGAFGVISIIANLLCRWVLYGELAGEPHYLIFCGAFSRFCALAVITFTKPAKNGGLGELFHNSVSKAAFFIWLPLIFVIIMLCNLPAFPDTKFRFILKSSAVVILPLLLTFFITKTAKRKIGGTTGDINGCVVECTDVSAMLLLVML